MQPLVRCYVFSCYLMFFHVFMSTINIVFFHVFLFIVKKYRLWYRVRKKEIFMEELRLFLYDNNLKIKDCAKMVGCTPEYMGSILSGKFIPGPSLKHRINKLLRGTSSSYIATENHKHKAEPQQHCET